MEPTSSKATREHIIDNEGYISVSKRKHSTMKADGTKTVTGGSVYVSLGSTTKQKREKRLLLTLAQMPLLALPRRPGTTTTWLIAAELPLGMIGDYELDKLGTPPLRSL